MPPHTDWQGSPVNASPRPVVDSTGAVTGVRKISDSITRIIGAVMIASILLFAGYTLVDWWQGTDTLPIRGLGTLVLLVCMVLWVRARQRFLWVVAGIAGLVFSTTVSVCTTLVTAGTDTTFEIAMAYGLVIAVLNVLVWRSVPAVLVGCAGAIGPPFLLMLSQHPPQDTLIDFGGVSVVTVVLAIVVLLVQRALVRELRELESELIAEASRDSLTGLPNRRSWLACLASWQAANADHSYDVLFFDLDRFKDVNDRFGHDAGDRVLVIFAQKLAELIPDEGAVSRFGGDEFVAFVPGGGAVTDRFLAVLQSAIAATEMRELKVDVSIGRAAGSAETDGEDALWRADRDLLESRRRNQGATLSTSP